MKLQLTDSEVTHLRKVMAWMRVEYCLDEDMQRGSLGVIKELADSGAITHAEAERAIARRADQVNHVPKYIRHGIKMLTKAVRDHDGHKGDVVDAATRDVQSIEQ